MSDKMLRSELDIDVRSIDEDKRQATFVASTERAVGVGYGDPEVLRMSGARLQRYRKNPVLLDSHSRFDLDSVIGRAEVKIQGRELHATCTYADTDRGERAWRLVKGGFVRAMSIGYSVNRAKVTRLREGEFDGEGEARVNGPATIVREWTLLEASNVPVPADEDAVRRSFFETIEKEATMAEPVKSGSIITRAMGEAGEPVAAVATPITTAAPVVLARASVEESPEERAVRALDIKRRTVLAITPRGLEGEAERALLEGLDVEAIRQRLLVAHSARLKPIGTPEPVETAKATAEQERSKPLPDWVTDDVLVRSLESLRS